MEDEINFMSESDAGITALELSLKMAHEENARWRKEFDETMDKLVILRQALHVARPLIKHRAAEDSEEAQQVLTMIERALE